jgi:hypothetical protein
MSRDTVDGCLGTSFHFFGCFGGGPGGTQRGLEVAGGVEGEFAEQFSGVAVDDPVVEVVDEQGDPGAREEPADSDGVQSCCCVAG